MKRTRLPETAGGFCDVEESGFEGTLKSLVCECLIPAG